MIEEGHQFVLTGLPAHLEHHCVSSLSCQVGKDRVLGEVKVLEASYLSIEALDFNCKQKVFKARDKIFNKGILICDSLFFQFLPESSSF